MRNTSSHGFTLLEMLLAVFIAVMVITIAVPSVSGVLAEQRMKRSFETFDELVRKAQELSMKERVTYQIKFHAESLVLEPADIGDFSQGENPPEVALSVKQEENFDLQLPASLIPDPPPEWTFWPNGTCEPAIITYRGSHGDWRATYDPLTAIPDFRTDI
jgi:prepilin-type N-terminal cleavage/methylation domain-containing protein